MNVCFTYTLNHLRDNERLAEPSALFEITKKISLFLEN